MRASLSRFLLAAAAASVAAVTLSSCSPGEPTASPAPSKPAATATTSPTPTPTTAPLSAPVTIDCDALVPPQVMYDFNPNFVLLPAFTPEGGSQAETILKRDGVACAWQNGSSGEMIVVAVANLATAELDELKNELVMTSNAVPTYGDEGYFQVRGGSGEAEVFSRSYWIVGVSPAFLEPGDASAIMDAAIAALP